MSRYLGVGNVDHTALLQTLLSVHYFSGYYHSRIFQRCSPVSIDPLLHFALPQIQRPLVDRIHMDCWQATTSVTWTATVSWVNPWFHVKIKVF